ncbi:hypothetical protein Plhal304r1_c054g0138821 [Plasmopara halstedii]
MLNIRPWLLNKIHRFSSKIILLYIDDLLGPLSKGSHLFSPTKLILQWPPPLAARVYFSVFEASAVRLGDKLIMLENSFRYIEIKIQVQSQRKPSDPSDVSARRFSNLCVLAASSWKETTFFLKSLFQHKKRCHS